MYPMSYSNNNDAESMADMYSSHRRNVSNPTFFSNHSFQTNNNSFSMTDPYNAYPQQRLGGQSVSTYHSNLRAHSPARSVQSAGARYHHQPPHNTFNNQQRNNTLYSSMSSSGSVATAPTLSRTTARYNTNNNNTRTLSSSSSVSTGMGGRSVDGWRGGNRRRYDATFSPLDQVPPYIHTYPPPESVIDTQWRQALRVDKCKKASVKKLMRMGFSEEHAVQALLETNQHEDHARQLLIRTRF